MSVDVLAVVISCGALVGFYVLLYAPLVARLDNEIKRTRFLLLLFPEEVAKGERRVVLLPAARCRRRRRRHDPSSDLIRAPPSPPRRRARRHCGRQEARREQLV